MSGQNDRPLIRPARLCPGDTICIISPCNGMKPESMEKPTEHIRAAGFNVKFGKNTFSFADGYAGSAEERAADFNNAVADDEVKMILFPGGEISNEILPLIDFEAVRQHPKIICSYSDGTTIVEAVHSLSGIVTFYGASTRTFHLYLDYNRQSFERRLTSGDTTYQKSSPWRVLCPGKGEGVLTGGYLINFDTLINSPYFRLPEEDYILIIEDHENFSSPKVVSKWMSDLIQKGVFDRARGLIFGHYSEDPEKVDQLCTVLTRLLRDRGIPVVYCDDFGHGLNMAIFPIGVKAALDTSDGSFTLSENGTV